MHLVPCAHFSLLDQGSVTMVNFSNWNLVEVREVVDFVIGLVIGTSLNVHGFSLS